MEKISNNGTAAVKKLRLQTLANGNPFMINSNDLPLGQCYLEYPNGSIMLVNLKVQARDFEVTSELSPTSIQKLRSMPDLYILVGSNGAGKSSVGPDYLPEYITAASNLFDGDKLLIKTLG